MKHKSLLVSKRYVHFIADRDRALEQMHNHAQRDVSRMLHTTLEQIEGVASRFAIKRDGINDFALGTAFDTTLGDVFATLAPLIYNRFIRMRKAARLLAYAGELEAIGRATKRVPDYTARVTTTHKITIENSRTLLDEDLLNKVRYDLAKLQMRLVGKFRLAVIQNLTDAELVSKVAEAYPELVIYRRPPRELKPFREADDDIPKKEFITTDILDPEDWDLILSSYKDSELPPSRFDQQSTFDPDKVMMRYNWEIEQDLTDDFVNQVRSGQVDAANQLGIQDFGWVAVIDNHTDECCLQRNGKTTSEIEAGLSDGSIDSDLCDATSPPAHPNCRCSLAPVSNVDEVEGPDWQSFGDWLNSKEA